MNADIVAYLPNALAVGSLMAMVVGVLVGLLVGAVPGLTPPMAIALLIPVSFHLPADQALILLVACYAAGIYGGSISAILLRAPGTSASIASAIEGFELTRQGRAVEAIRVATFASVLGGLLSGFVLLTLSPSLAPFSLMFGPAEYFLLALLGLTAIAVVAFGSLWRGLAAGLFGLWLSTVGIDNYSGFPRYTFGIYALEGGIGILPAIVGLFAFAQGLRLCEGNVQGSVAGVSRLGWNVWPRVSEIVHCRWALARGWLTGLVIGIVPAAGASVAQWVAYAWEVRSAKPGDRFGHGEIKGLAATEGSNNGVTGTSLIPLFVLGLPGGISAAVILGALTIHGLQPGMRLFSHNPSVIYTIMWGFIFANVVMGVLAPLLARTMAYVTLLPRGMLGPLILLFCVVGVYAGTNSVFDIWLMIALGLLGYYADRHGFVPAAILLGLILGPIAENGYRDMMTVAHGSPIAYIATRPVALVIVLLIVIALLLAFGRRRT